MSEAIRSNVFGNSLNLGDFDEMPRVELLLGDQHRTPFPERTSRAHAPPSTTLKRDHVPRTHEEDTLTAKELSIMYDAIMAADDPYAPMPSLSFDRKNLVSYRVPPSLASSSAPEYWTYPLDVDIPFAKQLPYSVSVIRKRSPPEPEVAESSDSESKSESEYELSPPCSPFMRAKHDLPSPPTSPMLVDDSIPSVSSETEPTPIEPRPVPSTTEYADLDGSMSDLTDLAEDEQDIANEIEPMDGGSDRDEQLGVPATRARRENVASSLDEDSDFAPGDDDTDSEYAPESTSSRPRPRQRRKTGQAPMATLATPPTRHASTSGRSLANVVVPTKVVGVKRRPNRAPKPVPEKRRRLADSTKSVVNNPSYGKVVRRKGKKAKAIPMTKTDPPYDLPLVKKVHHFGFLFDTTSIGRKVKMSEVPAKEIPRLKPHFNNLHRREEYLPPTDEEWVTMVAEFQRKALVEYAVHDEVSDKFLNEQLNKEISDSTNPEAIHPCPIPGCGRKAKLRKDVIKHVATHTARECFCPRCGGSFSRFDSLDRHFQKKPKCSAFANAYQYKYHRHIFSLFYLGLYENFDICDVVFKKLAKRTRFPLPDTENFKFASFHMVWDYDDDDDDSDEE